MLVTRWAAACAQSPPTPPPVCAKLLDVKTYYAHLSQRGPAKPDGERSLGARPLGAPPNGRSPSPVLFTHPLTHGLARGLREMGTDVPSGDGAFSTREIDVCLPSEFFCTDPDALCAEVAKGHLMQVKRELRSRLQKNKKQTKQTQTHTKQNKQEPNKAPKKTTATKGVAHEAM